MKNRLLAAGTHYAFSLAAMGILTLICIFLWYPGVLFSYAGGLQGVKLSVLFIALPLPILTFLIFKPKKKGLTFDLIAIGTLHVSLLIFAAYTLHEEKPHLLVIAGDTLHTLTKSEVDTLEFDYTSPANGIHWVYIDLPFNIGQVKAIKFASEMVDPRGLAGRANLYVPITSEPTSKKALKNYLEFFAEANGDCFRINLTFKNTENPVCLIQNTLKLKPAY